MTKLKLSKFTQYSLIGWTILMIIFWLSIAKGNLFKPIPLHFTFHFTNIFGYLWVRFILLAAYVIFSIVPWRNIVILPSLPVLGSIVLAILTVIPIIMTGNLVGIILDICAVIAHIVFAYYALLTSIQIILNVQYHWRGNYFLSWLVTVGIKLKTNWLPLVGSALIYSVINIILEAK